MNPFYRLAAPVALLLGACGSKAVGECSEEEPCPGFESCVDGTCVAKSCSADSFCGMEAYCDVGECVGGCNSQDDCYPGDSCAEGQCRSGGCRSTALDCGFNEYCDIATGECYPAPGYACRPCDGGSTDPDQCGNEENLCLNLGGGYGSFCGIQCDSEADCPGGYTCIPIGDEFGTVYTQQCITYCWLYLEDDSASRVSAPPPNMLTVPRSASPVTVEIR